MGAIALAVIALFLLLAWLAIRGRRDAFQVGAVHTQAEITDIRWKTVGPLPDRDRVAYPLLRFSLPDGSVFETRSEAPAAGPYEVGDRVGVLYLPDDPRRVRVDSQASPSTGSTSGT
jgi:hypothetical protein